MNAAGQIIYHDQLVALMGNAFEHQGTYFASFEMPESSKFTSDVAAFVSRCFLHSADAESVGSVIEAVVVRAALVNGVSRIAISTKPSA